MSYRGGRVDDRDTFGPDRRSWRGGGGGGGGDGGRPHPYRREDMSGGGGGGRPGGPSGGGQWQRGGHRGPRGPRNGNANGAFDRIRRGGFGGGPHGNRPLRVEKTVEEPKIDRTKICPFLLRVYLQKGSHHPASAFAVPGSEPEANSLVIYTWLDASLRELSDLVQVVHEDARRAQTELSFAFVYPDRTGTMVVKHVATISTSSAEQQRGGRNREDEKTLKDLKFEAGDHLSVALMG